MVHDAFRGLRGEVWAFTPVPVRTCRRSDRNLSLKIRVAGVFFASVSGLDVEFPIPLFPYILQWD